MVDNVQKLPLGRSLNQSQRRTVLEHIQLMSGRAPATLVKAHDKTNTIWKVKFDTDGTYTLPQITVPVHGSEFQRVPYQEGAKGFVGAADIETGNMTGLRAAKSPVDFTRPANLSSMVWHPLGNTDFKPAIDPNAHETYGASGGTVTHDGTRKSQVRTHASNGSSISTGGNEETGEMGPHNMQAKDGSTETNTTGKHKTNAPDGHDVSHDQTVAKNITSTSGDISASAGNISAPSGSMTAGVSMSAPSGSFASGAIGGLKMLGGILSGGGGGSGSPSLTIAPEEVSAATLRTNVPYTVAQLNAELPPSSGMAGGRALVTDAAAPSSNSGATTTGATTTPAPATVQFLSVLQGGGTTMCGAICLLQADGTWQWAAG